MFLKKPHIFFDYEILCGGNNFSNETGSVKSIVALIWHGYVDVKIPKILVAELRTDIFSKARAKYLT